MRKGLVILLVLSIVITSAKAFADKTSIGDMTFSFDGPLPPLTAEQQEFFEKFKLAVNNDSESEFKLLIDDSINSCAYASREIMFSPLKNKKAKGIAKIISDNRTKVKFFPVTKDFVKKAGFEGLAYPSTEPTAIFGINSGSTNKAETYVYSYSELLPVKQVGNKITLVSYCLTEKGNAIAERNKQRKAVTTTIPIKSQN